MADCAAWGGVCGTRVRSGKPHILHKFLGSIIRIVFFIIALIIAVVVIQMFPERLPGTYGRLRSLGGEAGTRVRSGGHSWGRLLEARRFRGRRRPRLHRHRF